MRNNCAFCGARIKQRPIDGTDPRNAGNGWYEVYECENGHTGRLEVDEPTEDNNWNRTMRYKGALREQDLVEA